MIAAPFFEIGPKNLLRLPELLDIASAAEAAGRRHRVSVILTVPTALIAPVRAAHPGLLVFAQGMDDQVPGPSVARVLPESLADAGAHGVMLNHDQSPLDPRALRRAAARARANGLSTMICAGSDDEVLGLLDVSPTIVLYEPPALIGAAGSAARPWIPGITSLVAERDPRVLMMHAGGVAAPDQAAAIMRAGAAGTGSTSGVLGAASPSAAAAAFIEATRTGWDERGAESAADVARGVAPRAAGAARG